MTRENDKIKDYYDTPCTILPKKDLNNFILNDDSKDKNFEELIQYYNSSSPRIFKQDMIDKITSYLEQS